MRSIARRAGGGALLVLGLVATLAAVRTFRRMTPLLERADVPGGFAVLFVVLLFLAGLGLSAAGTALLGCGADWVGRRARSTFRAAGYLVVGSLPIAVLSVPVTGQIGIGVPLLVVAALLGTLAVLLGLAVGVASVAYRNAVG